MFLFPPPLTTNQRNQASQKEETYSEQVRVLSAKHKEVRVTVFQFKKPNFPHKKAKQCTACLNSNSNDSRLRPAPSSPSAPCRSCRRRSTGSRVSHAEKKMLFKNYPNFPQKILQNPPKNERRKRKPHPTKSVLYNCLSRRKFRNFAIREKICF